MEKEVRRKKKWKRAKISISTISSAKAVYDKKKKED